MDTPIFPRSHQSSTTHDRLQNLTQKQRIKAPPLTPGETMETQPLSSQALLPKPPPPGILKLPFRLPDTDPLKSLLDKGLPVLFEREYPVFNFIRALEYENFQFQFTCHEFDDGLNPKTEIRTVRYQPQYLQDKGVELLPVEIEPGLDCRALLFERHGPGIWYSMVGFARLKFPLDIVMMRLDNFVLPEAYRTWA